MASAGMTFGQLQKSLGIAFGISISIGGTIGAGILKVPGLVANEVSVTWIILLLWVFGGIHALVGANIQAELVASIPKAGGLYVPVRAGFGDFMGLVVGWSDWLSSVAAGASLALASTSFIALIIPAVTAHENLISIAIVLAVLILNWLGVKQGGISQTIGSTLKFLLLCLLVGAVATLPSSTGAATGGAAQTALPITFFSIIVAYQLVYGAFSGWSYPIYFVEEDQRAAVNIPKAMAVSIMSIAVVYLVMNAVLFHAVPIETIRASEFPAAAALGRIFGPSVAQIIAALGFVLAVTCLNSTVMGLPRILYGLGRDGLFLPVATRVNKGGTPDVALAISGAFLVLLLLSGSYQTVFLLLGALQIFTFALSDLVFFVLRLRMPHLKRPYRALGFPWLPILALLIDGLLLIGFVAADTASGVYMFALIGLCLPVHLWLRRRRLATGMDDSIQPVAELAADKSEGSDLGAASKGSAYLDLPATETS